MTTGASRSPSLSSSPGISGTTLEDANHDTYNFGLIRLCCPCVNNWLKRYLSAFFYGTLQRVANKITSRTLNDEFFAFFYLLCNIVRHRKYIVVL